MAKKINDCYEYKEAPIRQAMAYASFGWLIGKRSKHYSRKYNCDVVTLRRDFLIGANPTIRECEKEYLRLEKGHIPAKYKSHSFLRAVGRAFVILITIALLAFGLAQTATGVYDGLKNESRVRAIYNTIVENELITAQTVSADTVDKAYVDFVRKNPKLDTFAELYAFSNGKADADSLLSSYKKWLFKFGEADLAREESFVEADSSIVEKDGEYVAEQSALNDVLDIVRSTFAFINFDYLLSGMPIWIDSTVLSGAVALFLFIIMVIIQSAADKAKKKKNRLKCAELMIECSKNASSALFDMKAEHRELRTKKDASIYDLQTMFTKVMDDREDDE